MKNIHKIIVILLSAYISMVLVKSIMNHTDAGIGPAAFVMLFMFAVLYMVLYWMPHKVYTMVFSKKHNAEKPIQVFFKEHVSGDTVSNSDDFDTLEEAVDFMKSSLHVEMTNIKKYRNISSAKEAIEYWKQYGMDYYIFQDNEAFSSLAYVTKQAYELWENNEYGQMQIIFRDLFRQDLTQEEVAHKQGGMIGDEALPLGKYVWAKDNRGECIEYYVSWIPHARGDSNGKIYKDGTHEHLPTLPQIGEVTQWELDLREELRKKGLYPY